MKPAIKYEDLVDQVQNLKATWVNDEHWDSLFDSYEFTYAQKTWLCQMWIVDSSIRLSRAIIVNLHPEHITMLLSTNRFIVVNAVVQYYLCLSTEHIETILNGSYPWLALDHPLCTDERKVRYHLTKVV